MEHIALNVPDVHAMSAWYVEHLGMKVASSSAKPPYATFVTDSAGRSMLELYTWEDPAPPAWRDRDRVQLHLAFLTDALDTDRDRLLAAGATLDGEPVHKHRLPSQAPGNYARLDTSRGRIARVQERPGAKPVRRSGMEVDNIEGVPPGTGPASRER